MFPKRLSRDTGKAVEKRVETDEGGTDGVGSDLDAEV